MGSCAMWGVLMSRSRSAGIASSSVRSRRRWPGWMRVEQAVVIARRQTTPETGEGVSDKQLVGYVVLDQEMMLVREPEREAQLVAQWQEVYEGLYSGVTFNAGAPAVLGEDFEGWNSSYTGTPIPLEQMREWRAAAVDQIREFGPGRVLEIGVGSGLLLAPLAPVCVEYWGTDFSAPTIQTLQAAVAGQSWGDRVRLLVQPADVADGLPEGHFDVVVLNSVVQYFPARGICLMCWRWRCGCWRRAGRCLSATCATCRCCGRLPPGWCAPTPPVMRTRRGGT